MKLSIDTIRNTLHHLVTRTQRRRTALAYPDDEPPLRAELFGADQMEQHGRNLAGMHRLSQQRAPVQLLARLAENEDVLMETCALLTAAISAPPISNREMAVCHRPCTLMDTPAALQIVGRYAYVADSLAGLEVIDVSNPTRCVRVAIERIDGINSTVKCCGD